MPLRSDMSIRDYLVVLWDWKRFIGMNLLLIPLLAIVYLVVVPPQYKSTTTILIIPQSVPESYIQSTVSMRVEGRLATIQKQVTSRTVLSKVMNELKLFPKMIEKSEMDKAVEEMRKRIDIEVVQNPRMRDQSTWAFSISFAYEDPELAMHTTSRLTSLFIEENLRTREQQAVGTSEFLESQLKETKANLEIQEEKLKQYKLKYMGELPQEIQTNMNSLTRLQDYIRMNSDRIRSAEDRKVFLEARISTMEWPAQPGSGGKDPLLAEDPVRMLAIKRSQLAELSSKYTENHPTLISLRKEVAELEKSLREATRESTARESGNPMKTGSSPPNLLYPSRQADEMQLLKAQVVSTDAEISSLKKENERTHKEIAYLQNKVERAPRREQELIALTRDYDNLKKSYDSLLKKRLDANISENLEERQKGEQFQVLDPANLPERPFKPKKWNVMGIAFLIAVGFGFGGAISLEGMEETLRGKKDFEQFFKLRVFACIPDVEDNALDRRQALRRGAIIGGFLLFCIGILALIWFYEAKIRLFLNI